jgi:ribonuclease BN (tRNA processing enzyme)
MLVRLVPSHGRSPGRFQPFTTFLIDRKVALDAGSIGIGLTPAEQRRIRHVLITHTHADHTASLPIFVAEVYPFLDGPIRIHATPPVIASLKRHVFNELVWPDFRRIALAGAPGAAIEYAPCRYGKPFDADGLACTAIRVNHTVDTSGFLVDDGRAAVLFSSDTWHTDELWRVANRTRRLRAIYVDVSYPSDMESLARRSRHFTPAALAEDLKKLRRDVPVLAVHLKPTVRTRVAAEIRALRDPRLRVAEIGRDVRW